MLSALSIWLEKYAGSYIAGQWIGKRNRVDLEMERTIISFEEELKKFHKSMELGDVEEQINSQDRTDVAEILVRIMSEQYTTVSGDGDVVE